MSEPVPRPFSSRRFILLYTAMAAAAVLLVFLLVRPRFLPDGMDFWVLALLLIGLQVLGLLVYQWRIRRHIQRLLQDAGLENLPSARSSDSLETWTRRYVASAAREIAEDRDLFDALFELRNGLAGRRKALERNALAGQGLFENPADGTVVVDDPDRFHGGCTHLVMAMARS